MAAVRVRCETRYYDGQGHGFFNKDPWKTITLAEADRFLASLGWLEGEPALQVPEVPPSTGSEAPAKPQRKARERS
jgi:hypothetical protein